MLLFQIIILSLQTVDESFIAFFSSPLSGGPVLTPSFPPMQVQQLLQMKKQQQAAAVQAAAQQKAGQSQQGQATVQQKVEKLNM